MLVAGKSLFLVIDDDTGSGVLRDLDQRDTAVVRARTSKARDVNSLAALQSIPDRRNLPARDFAADPMKTATRQRRLAEPAREAIRCICDPGIPRSDPYSWLAQAVCLEGLVRWGELTIIGGAQQCRFAPRDKPMLASTSETCET